MPKGVSKGLICTCEIGFTLVYKFKSISAINSSNAHES